MAGVDRGDDGPGVVVADQADVVQRLCGCGQEIAGDVPVHDERLGGIADAGPLRLAVDQQGQSHLEVGRGVDVQVAVTVPVYDVGHGGVFEHGLDERRPAARDEAIDQSPQAHELPGRLVTRVLHQDERVLG